MDERHDPRDHLRDYHTYLRTKVLRLKAVLDRGYARADLNVTIETLRQIEADLFRLKNVGALMEMRRAA